MRYLILLLGASLGYADTITVSLNTSSLAGGQFSIVFDLIDGDATANNTVTVTNALFGGGSLVGSPTLTGDAAGSLAGTVTLGDSSFFNEYFHEFTPGSTLTFDLGFTNNFAGGTPDSLTFMLIDNSTGLPVPTLAPLGSDVLLAIDLTGSSPVFQAYGADRERTEIVLAAPIQVGTTAPVPEPASAWLGMTVMAGVGLLAMRRRSRLLRLAQQHVTGPQ